MSVNSDLSSSISSHSGRSETTVKELPKCLIAPLKLKTLIYIGNHQNKFGEQLKELPPLLKTFSHSHHSVDDKFQAKYFPKKEGPEDTELKRLRNPVNLGTRVPQKQWSRAIKAFARGKQEQLIMMVCNPGREAALASSFDDGEPINAAIARIKRMDKKLSGLTYLLEAQVPVSRGDGSYLLNIASANGDVVLLDALRKRGFFLCVPYGYSPYVCSPVQLACKFGHSEVFKYFVDHEPRLAKVYTRWANTYCGNSIGSKKCVEYLLKKGLYDEEQYSQLRFVARSAAMFYPPLLDKIIEIGKLDDRVKLSSDAIEDCIKSCKERVSSEKKPKAIKRLKASIKKLEALLDQ